MRALFMGESAGMTLLPNKQVDIAHRRYSDGSEKMFLLQDRFLYTKCFFSIATRCSLQSHACQQVEGLSRGASSVKFNLCGFFVCRSCLFWSPLEFSKGVGASVEMIATLGYSKDW